MTIPVKFFHSRQTGAPRCSGTAGDLIALLDACLVNGFNVKAIDTLTVLDGVATATVAGGHGYELEQVIRIDGATPSGLNGEKRVTWIDTNNFKFAADGIADGSATGTISARAAPLNWLKPFSDTNKGAWKSADVESTGLYLFVDDTSAMDASAWGAETATDINTFTGRFPTVGQSSFGSRWRKSNAASTAARSWELIGDGRLFYLLVRWSGTSDAAVYAFGDITSYKPGDAYGCIIAGHQESAPSDIRRQCFGVIGHTPGEVRFLGNAIRIARSHTQIGAAATVMLASMLVDPREAQYNNFNFMGAGGPAYPSPVHNGLNVSRPVLCAEGAPHGNCRGEWPGMLHPLHSRPLSHGDIVDNIAGLPGRRLLLAQIGGFDSYYGSYVSGRIAFDITGPWR